MMYEITPTGLFFYSYFFGFFSESAYSSSKRYTLRTYSSKIKVPRCLCCDTVFVNAPLLHPTPFGLTRWNLNQEVYMWWSKNAFFYFLKCSYFWGEIYACSFLWLSQYHAYNTFKMTNKDDWYIKLKSWMSRKCCMWLNCIDAKYDVIKWRHKF